MKKTIILIFFIVLFFISLSGCNEESQDNLIDDVLGDDNPIEQTIVHVSISATALVRNASGPVGDVRVRFDLSKSNGNATTLYRTTYDDPDYYLYGQAEVIYGFNLDVNETITIEASIPGSGANSDYWILNYEKAYNAVGAGGNYNWRPALDLFM